MKVLTIVGARPHFIKEALLSSELSCHSGLTEVLVHTGQHHDPGLSEVFFTSLGIPHPNYNLGISGGSHASMTARIMQALEGVLEKEKPGLVVVFGDTNTTLAGALTAAKMHFPVCHVESGVRTGFLSNPEEVNRICTDHLSSINCAPTLSCFNNLLRENLGNTSCFTGDLMFDAFKKYSSIAKNGSYSFFDIWNVETTLPDQFYYLTCHREENSSKHIIREILLAMEQLDNPVVYPVHPRMQQFIIEICKEDRLKNTLFIHPVGYLESLFLLEKTIQLTTDSGGLQREAFFAGKKCVTLLPFPASEELLEGNRNTLLEVISQETILHAMGTSQSVDSSWMPFGTGRAAKEIVHMIERFF